MKINEIALNENVWTDAAKLAGKALPRIERLPGETMIDAIKRTTSKLGGVKSADNLASPSGPVAGTNTGSGFQAPGRVIPTQANTSYNLNLPKTSAADPVPPSSGPAVWRRPGDPKFDTTPSTLQGPSTSGTIPKKTIVPAPKPRADTSAYDQEVRNAHDLNPGMPNKGKPSAEAEAYAAEKAAQAARTAVEKQAAADDLARQVSPGADPPMTSGGQAAPEMIAEPLPSWLSPKGAKGSKTTGGRQEPSINAPADDLANQIKPGADAPKTTSSQQSSINRPAEPANGINLSKDEVLDLIKNNRSGGGGGGGGGAAQAAEKEVAQKSGMGPWGKAAAVTLGLPAAYTLGTGAYNKFKPDEWPEAPGAPQLKVIPPVVTPEPQDWSPGGVVPAEPAASAAATNDPTPDQIKTALENDPKWQDLQRQKKELGIDESTKQLNRMVYLSRP